jgi:arylformamidase
MVTYPGDPDVRLEREKSIADGDPANISRLDFGVHTGTHVDAPLHFFDGAPAAEDLALCLPLKLTGSDGAPARAVLLPA